MLTVCFFLLSLSQLVFIIYYCHDWIVDFVWSISACIEMSMWFLPSCFLFNSTTLAVLQLQYPSICSVLKAYVVTLNFLTWYLVYIHTLKYNQSFFSDSLKPKLHLFWLIIIFSFSLSIKINLYFVFI